MSIYEFIKKYPEKRERDFFLIQELSGSYNKKLRQGIILELTGKKYPVANCGINFLLECVEEYLKSK